MSNALAQVPFDKMHEVHPARMDARRRRLLVAVRRGRTGLYRNPLTVYVYALVHPETDAVRYVGQSSDLVTRFKTHCTRAVGWIAQLQAQGMRPRIIVLETCSTTSALEREDHWIRFYLREGADLANGVVLAPPSVREWILSYVRTHGMSRTSARLNVCYRVVRRIRSHMSISRATLALVRERIAEAEVSRW